MWKEGTVNVDGDQFKYWMKYYDTGSVWGIGHGKISKLMLKRENVIVANYDRGWDVEPVDETTEAVVALLIKRDN